MSMKSRQSIMKIAVLMISVLGVPHAYAESGRKGVGRTPAAVVVEGREPGNNDRTSSGERRALAGLVLWTETGREAPADYKERYLLVHFWATWCAPCITELPHILAYRNSATGKTALAARDIKLLVVSEDFQISQVRNFLVRHPMSKFQIMLDDDRKLITHLLDGQGYQLPLTILVNREAGAVVWRHNGSLDWQRPTSWMKDMDRELDRDAE